MKSEIIRKADRAINSLKRIGCEMTNNRGFLIKNVFDADWSASTNSIYINEILVEVASKIPNMEGVDGFRGSLRISDHSDWQCHADYSLDPSPDGLNLTSLKKIILTQKNVKLSEIQAEIGPTYKARETL